MKKALFATLISLLSASAFADKPQIQWANQYDFRAIETFQWQSTPDSSLAQRNPFMHSRIVTSIEFHLAEAGLTEVDSDPDVYVTYHTSTNERIRLQSETWGYSFGGYGRGAWGHYGYGRVGPITTDTRVIEYDEGTLVVDIWDADSAELVWRGSVTEVFSDDPQKAEKQAVKAIERMAERGRKLWERANR